MLNTSELGQIKALAGRNKCSHTYIIDGSAGVGKSDFAQECAKIFLCTGKDKPCGECPSCRRFAFGGHSDVFVIGRDKIATMDNIRELIRRSTLMPNEAEKQIFIVENAGRLRRDAQNALLKIIEEPPESVIILLLTDMRSSLLPTVLSRGTKIHLSGMSDGELRAYLRAKYPLESPQRLENAAEKAKGNRGEAEKLLSKEYAALSKNAENLFALALGNDRYAFACALLVTKYKREDASALLNELLELISDALEGKYGVGKGSSCAATKKTLSRMAEAVVSCTAALDGNANVNAAMTRLVSDFFAAKAG